MFKIQEAFRGVQVFIEGFLRFIGCQISDSILDALSVVAIDPFQRFPFQLADGFPGFVRLAWRDNQSKNIEPIRIRMQVLETGRRA